MNEGMADTQNRKEMKGRKRGSNYFLAEKLKRN